MEVNKKVELDWEKSASEYNKEAISEIQKKIQKKKHSIDWYCLGKDDDKQFETLKDALVEAKIQNLYLRFLIQGYDDAFKKGFAKLSESNIQFTLIALCNTPVGGRNSFNNKTFCTSIEACVQYQNVTNLKLEPHYSQSDISEYGSIFHKLTNLEFGSKLEKIQISDSRVDLEFDDFDKFDKRKERRQKYGMLQCEKDLYEISYKLKRNKYKSNKDEFDNLETSYASHKKLIDGYPRLELETFEKAFKNVEILTDEEKEDVDRLYGFARFSRDEIGKSIATFCSDKIDEIKKSREEEDKKRDAKIDQ